MTQSQVLHIVSTLSFSSILQKRTRSSSAIVVSATSSCPVHSNSARTPKKPIMPNDADPVAADPAPPVGGGADSTEANLPFSAPTKFSWEAQALEKARAITDRKTLHILNGRRVTAWRICVEKKRKELAAIFGISPGSLTELPPDCKAKVLEFLAPERASGRLTPADALRLSKKRTADVVEKCSNPNHKLFLRASHRDYKSMFDNLLTSSVSMYNVHFQQLAGLGWVSFGMDVFWMIENIVSGDSVLSWLRHLRTDRTLRARASIQTCTSGGSQRPGGVHT